MAMAMSADEELTNCTVCLVAYDESDHKPKFLSCFHTFCLTCMKSLVRNRAGSIPCPTCRKETLRPLGQEAGLTTNNYIRKSVPTSVSLTPSYQSLAVNDCWCLKCKKKAAVSCLTDHSRNTTIMEGKPAQVFIDLHESLDDEEALLDSALGQWKHKMSILSASSKLLDWGVGRLKRMDDDMNRSRNPMSVLLSAKKAVDDLKGSLPLLPATLPQKEAFTAASFALEINSIARTRRIAQSETELVQAPSTNSVKVLEKILLLGFRTAEDEELNNDQKDQLKRLEEAVSDTTDDVAASLSPRNGYVVDNFCVTMTFFRNGRSSNNSKLGSVFIKPHPHIYSKLRLVAEDSWGAPMSLNHLYGIEINATDAASFVLIGNVEAMMGKMFLDNEFLYSSNSNDGPFSASEMEVKIVKFPEVNAAFYDSGFRLGFFLDDLSQVVPEIFRSASDSIPFGRIVKGGEVIQTLSKLPPYEREIVQVAVDGDPIRQIWGHNQNAVMRSVGRGRSYWGN